jgi:dihydrofolate reductase
MVELIVAITKNGCIGKGNNLPWDSMKNDMQFFRKTTINKAVIMGRNTFESINSKPLPHRLNIVISSSLNDEDTSDDVIVVSSLDEAIDVARKRELTPIVIGGGKLYAEAVDVVDTMYITMVATELEGDTFFPDIDYSLWGRRIVDLGLADDLNDFGYTIYELKKRQDVE